MLSDLCGLRQLDEFGYAISASNLRTRPGMLALMETARAGSFDVVIAEALDRISRDQEDVAAIFKRLNQANVKPVTLTKGEINELHVGLKGTMTINDSGQRKNGILNNELYLSRITTTGSAS